jgi:hypothetical protein
MSREDLTALATRLAPELGGLREQRLHRVRDGPRRQAIRDHYPAILSSLDQVLLTVLYLRHVCSQKVLAEMLGLTQRTLSTPIKQIRRLLQEHGVTITPTALCFSTVQQIREIVDVQAPVTARQQLTHTLSDPRLTGMPRTDLTALIDRLSVQQAALIENRRHRQRRGPRQPGTRSLSSAKGSPTPNGSWSQCSINANSPPGTSSPRPSTSASAPSTTPLADALPVIREADITIAPPPHASTARNNSLPRAAPRRA